jgi:hypothetical protein
MLSVMYVSVLGLLVLVFVFWFWSADDVLLDFLIKDVGHIGFSGNSSGLNDEMSAMMPLSGRGETSKMEERVVEKCLFSKINYALKSAHMARSKFFDTGFGPFQF